MTHRKTSIKVSQILLHQKKNFSSDKIVVYTCCEKNEIIGRFLKLIKKKKKKINKGEERIFNEQNKKLQNKFTLSDNNPYNFFKEYYLLYSCFPTGSWQSLTTFKNQ
jgi:hypothetical protein